ncbi:MAG: SpoIID/LytB domain-containing protein [Acidimicrobiia bacterium]|nr:SpoIID/LytB domain-containing protein [Acidimicrobiia bacterium]
MKFRRFFFLAALLLTPIAAVAQVLPPDAIARFHINEANYYVDVGKYLEAIEDLDTAFEYSQAAAIKAEALSLKANVLSTFLDNSQAAAQEYNNILQNFVATAFYEPAIFQSAMLQYQAGDLNGARTLFQRYMKEFPNGPRATTADFLIDQIAAGTKAPAAEKALGGRAIRIALAESDSLTLESVQPMTVTFADGKTKMVGTAVRITATEIGNETSRVTSNSPIRVEKRTYRGAMLLIPDAGRMRIVNKVPIEEYLYSVVASEVSPSWHMEALKAQAVAARTYAYYHVVHPRSPGKFDVFDDIRSQVYGGYSKEHARVREAVDATRGQILTSGGRVVLAYFTSNNGGTTADPQFVFGTALPYLKANADEYSTTQPLGKWTRKFSVAAVEEALQRAGYDVSAIRGITPLKTCPSGRLVELMVEHTKGRLKLNTRAQFRRAINQYVKPAEQPENLPEILMNISINGDSIEMSGGGWGHGVGLSQYGAKGMAGKGLPYSRILMSYYVNTELTTIY